MTDAREIERSPRRVVHAVACCQECDWTEDHCRLAARAATKHARETGHNVSVEQGINYFVRARGGQR